MKLKKLIIIILCLSLSAACFIKTETTDIKYKTNSFNAVINYDSSVSTTSTPNDNPMRSTTDTETKIIQIPNANKSDVLNLKGL